jgi:uncharacterized protein YodC (DUF2158 family)
MSAETKTAPKPTFPPGAVVKLQSGGPFLTVVDEGKHTGLLWCRWMDADGKIKETCFPVESLTPVRAP